MKPHYTYSWTNRWWIDADGTAWRYYRSPFERHWVRARFRGV